MKLLSAPISLDLAITGKCNLKCKYCSHFSGPGDVDNDLPGDEWNMFFKELNRLMVMRVTLQGAEPFSRKDIQDIIEGIVRNRMRFSILTNGTLVTEKLANFLSSTGRCDFVQVSIDGSIPDTHDSFRGKGTFFMAIRGIDFLRRYDIPVSVRVTVHRKNVGELKEITTMLLEDIGLESFSTNAASYMGLCRKNTEMVQLTAEERSLAMESLLSLERKYPGRIIATAGPLADAKIWLKMDNALKKGQKYAPRGGFLTGCNGPFEKLAVRTDGIIVPCIQMSHIELGRINKVDLKEIWMNHPLLKKARERHRIPLNDFEFCKGCEYINYCTGNCPALAYTTIGIENHPSPESCLKHFLDDGGRLPNHRLQ